MPSPDSAQTTSYASKRTQKVFLRSKQPMAKESLAKQNYELRKQYIQDPNFSCLTCNLVITRKQLFSWAYLLGLILEVSDHCKMHLFLFWQYTSCLLYNYTQFQTLSATKRKNTLRFYFFFLFSYLLWNRKLQNLLITRDKQLIWIWLDIK